MNKISIIIPVYKVEEYLAKCVDSLINQTYHNLEVILVNDGSPDNCQAICDQYAVKDNRVKVIHKKNGGVSSARNKGIDNATGDYILFIDADDWIEKDMCEYLLNNAIKYNADISCCGFYEERPNIIKIHAVKNDVYLNTNKSCLEAFLEKKYFGFSIWNKLFKKEVILNKFDEELAIGEDAYFLFKAILNSKSTFFGHDVKYHYNIRNNSATQSGFNIKSFGTLDFLDRIFHDIDTNDSQCLLMVNSLRFNEYLAVLNKMLYHGKEYEYIEEFGRIKQTLINAIKDKKIQLSLSRKLAFKMFLRTRKIYVYLIKKYYKNKIIS